MRGDLGEGREEKGHIRERPRRDYPGCPRRMSENGITYRNYGVDLGDWRDSRSWQQVRSIETGFA